MALEELSIQVIGLSLMDNSKMEKYMDILELLINVIVVMNVNLKMESI